MAFTLDNFLFATVIKPKFYKYTWDTELGVWEVPAITEDGEEPTAPDFELDSLRISNIAEEGPTKTYKGGIYNKTQARYGKTVRLEMEDAIATVTTMKGMFGAIGGSSTEDLAFGNTFSGAKYVVIGNTFVIDKATGNKKNIKFKFNEFLPDELLNLTLESEGDFAVMNFGGELSPDDDTGLFFSISETE